MTLLRVFILFTMSLLLSFALGSFALLSILGSTGIFNVWLIVFFYLASVTFIAMFPKALRDWNAESEDRVDEATAKAIDCIGNLACFAGNCIFCTDGPYMEYCGGCRLFNCGFIRCIDLQEKEAAKCLTS